MDALTKGLDAWLLLPLSRARMNHGSGATLMPLRKREEVQKVLPPDVECVGVTIEPSAYTEFDVLHRPVESKTKSGYSRWVKQYVHFGHESISLNGSWNSQSQQMSDTITLLSLLLRFLVGETQNLDTYWRVTCWKVLIVRSY